MNQEEILFKIYIEFMLLSELHQDLDDDQVGNVVESASSLFDAQPGDVIARFLDHARQMYNSELGRGADARANVIESIISHYASDE